MKQRLRTDRRRHGSNESNNPSTKTTNPCRFYKLIISPTIQLNKSRLPETFASAYGDEISEACCLTVPTGETHQVALVEEDNKLWFQDGWEQFVDRFSIVYGYFMIFTYNGNSNFRVNVFDLTACEISYHECDKGTNFPVQNEPYVGDLRHGFSEELDCEDHDNLVLENLHSPSASHKISDVEVVELDSEDDEMKSEELSETIADTGEESEGSQLGSELPIWLKNYNEEMKVIVAAGIPMPANPFFVALMRPYVNAGFLNIPRAFARKHMKCKAGDSIKVEMCDGRQWVVRCCRSLLSCSFGKGWIQFVRQACLEVGDVCLFELIDAENYMFQVHIAESSPRKAAPVTVSGSELPIWLKNYKEEMKVIAAADIPMPSNPFFVALMKPYALHSGGFLNIPKTFAREHMKCKAGDSIKVEMCGGRQWVVRCCRSLSTCSLGKGWIQVVRQARLEVRDVCLFELFDAENYVFKVHVAKSSHINAARVMV